MKPRKLTLDGFIKLLLDRGISLEEFIVNPLHNKELEDKDINHARLMADTFFKVSLKSGDFPNFSSKDILHFANPNIGIKQVKSNLSLNGMKRNKKLLREYYHKMIDEIYGD